jgi:hypothetical protein
MRTGAKQALIRRSLRVKVSSEQKGHQEWIFRPHWTSTVIPSWISLLETQVRYDQKLRTFVDWCQGEHERNQKKPTPIQLKKVQLSTPRPPVDAAYHTNCAEDVVEVSMRAPGIRLSARRLIPVTETQPIAPSVPLTGK